MKILSWVSSIVKDYTLIGYFLWSWSKVSYVFEDIEHLSASEKPPAVQASVRRVSFHLSFSRQQRDMCLWCLTAAFLASNQTARVQIPSGTPNLTGNGYLIDRVGLDFQLLNRQVILLGARVDHREDSKN